MSMRGFLLATLLAVATTTHAEVPAIQMPGDTKLVVFQFDPNNTYTILARPNSITNLQVGDEEEITGIALGDSIQWLIEKMGVHIFVKPLRPDLVTSGTIVTNKRAYQVTLKSVKETDRWYQRVTWKYPESLMMRQIAANGTASPRTVAGLTSQSSEGEPLPSRSATVGVNVDQLNFDYPMDGDSPSWKPSQVFDDGRTTWIRIPTASQEMPAIFAMSNESDPELVNFTVKGDYVVVHRVMPGILLKSGKLEVRVRNGAVNSPSSNWKFWKR